MIKRIMKLLLFVPAFIITALSFPALVIIWIITGDGNVFNPDRTLLIKIIEW